MKYWIPLIIATIILLSCDKDDEVDMPIPTVQINEPCDLKTEIMSPIGYEVNEISEISFNGSVQSFQFIDDNIGFAMLSKNVGGYVEVFKTSDGGETWSNLQVGINKYPRNILFKDENFGIITVHDVTGCPPPNCQHKCVFLKTINGGKDWEEVEIEKLKGILYHPTFDSEGNLYANLKLSEHSSLMKSVDQGMSWDTLYSSAEVDFSLITYSFEILDDKIYISGKDGKILVLNTEGQLLKTIDTDGASIWDLEVIDENNLIVVQTGRVIKSTNGGASWEIIYQESARMIGFDSVEKGIMLLKESDCPTDVYQVNDLIASTSNGGTNWLEADDTTTNLRIKFSNSQRMGEGIWFMMIGNKLIQIKEL